MTMLAFKKDFFKAPKKKAKVIKETDVIAYGRKRLADHYGCVSEKFVSPSRRSVPDDIVTIDRAVIKNYPGFLTVIRSNIFFIEYKAPGKLPTEAQQRDHERRRAMGVTVLVIDSYVAVETYFPPTH